MEAVATRSASWSRASQVLSLTVDGRTRRYFGLIISRNITGCYNFNSRFIPYLP